MIKLSIVGKGYHTDEQVVGYYNTGDRMKYWAKLVRSGEAFGGFCSDLLSLLIPGLGPICGRVFVLHNAVRRKQWRHDPRHQRSSD
jgi:hypothetical protein